MTFRLIRSAAISLVLVQAFGCTAGSDDVAEEDPSGEALALVQPVDWGYGSLPSVWTDVNRDGLDDYCRFVGNRSDRFISCKLDGNPEEYAYNSVRGIDVGYGNRPREFTDYNGDGRIDYCRWVGNDPNIRRRCVRGGVQGFASDQYYDPATDRPERQATTQPPPSTTPPPSSPSTLFTYTCQCNNPFGPGYLLSPRQECIRNDLAQFFTCTHLCAGGETGTLLNSFAHGPC